MQIDKATLSHVVGDDLRRSERSIEVALRDIAQLTISTIETSHRLGLSATVSHRMLGPVSEAYANLSGAHAGMAGRAHRFYEQVGRSIGLTETDWGGSDGKPTRAALDAEPAPAPAETQPAL